MRTNGIGRDAPPMDMGVLRRAQSDRAAQKLLRLLAAYCIEGRHTLLHGEKAFGHVKRFGLDALNAGSDASP